jgi:FtsP/CotA-like multicopper oxidase with cupredoxin domain
MNYNCSIVTDGTPCTPGAGLAKFKFKSGKSHRLRLVNAGAEGMQRFSIGDHTMTVMANDFVPVKPYTTNVVTLGVRLTLSVGNVSYPTNH